jgi:hypothetical protein
MELKSYEGSIQQLEMRRNISAISSLALSILSNILYIGYRNDYEKFQEATTTEKAVELYNRSKTKYYFSGYIGAIAGVTLISTTYFQINLCLFERKR